MFAEDEGGRFANTPMSECLRTGAPGPGRNTALLLGEVFFAAFGELMHSVRTGTPAFDKVYGQSFFDFLSTNKEIGGLFDVQMTALYEREVEALLHAYDFAGAGRIIDVGGGRGTVIRALLARFPDLQCGLFDLPAVVDRTRESFAAVGLSDRCTIEGGSFFEAIPPATTPIFSSMCCTTGTTRRPLSSSPGFEAPSAGRVACWCSNTSFRQGTHFPSPRKPTC